jgi:hypothetical protein
MAAESAIAPKVDLEIVNMAVLLSLLARATIAVTAQV